MTAGKPYLCRINECMEMFISGLSSYFREGCVMVSKTELVIYVALFPQKQAIEMRQDRFQIRRTDMAALSKNMGHVEHADHNMTTVVMATVVIGILGLFTSFF